MHNIHSHKKIRTTFAWKQVGKRRWRIIKVYFNLWELIIYVLQQVKYLFPIFFLIAKEPCNLFIYFSYSFLAPPSFANPIYKGEKYVNSNFVQGQYFFMWEEFEKKWLFLKNKKYITKCKIHVDQLAWILQNCKVQWKFIAEESKKTKKRQVFMLF
jgi:hypothetical protein